HLAGIAPETVHAVDRRAEDGLDALRRRLHPGVAAGFGPAALVRLVQPGGNEPGEDGDDDGDGDQDRVGAGQLAPAPGLSLRRGCSFWLAHPATPFNPRLSHVQGSTAPGRKALRGYWRTACRT